MPISFPTPTVVGQTYTFGDRTWQWDGTVWNSIGSATGAQGPQGPQGASGTNGTNGTNGIDGTDGTAATVTAGTTTTGASGSSAVVTNSGTTSAAVFDFTIPTGPQGAQGATGATPSQTVVFNRAGTASVSTGAQRFRFAVAATILDVTAAIGTAPTGAALNLEVKKNGTTIFSGTKPSIAAGANATASLFVPTTTAFAAGDYVTVDITQVGSTVAGADLTVFVRYQ